MLIEGVCQSCYEIGRCPGCQGVLTGKEDEADQPVGYQDELWHKSCIPTVINCAKCKQKIEVSTLFVHATVMSDSMCWVDEYDICF
jgi:hypothetical protein